MYGMKNLLHKNKYSYGQIKRDVGTYCHLKISSETNVKVTNCHMCQDE